MSDPEAVVVLENVSKHYLQGEELIRAVEEVDLRVRPGDFGVITGRSGGGKTTLLSLIGGLTKPTSGQLRCYGMDWGTLPDLQAAALRATKIGFIFQFASLFPPLTVLENVLLPTTFLRSDPEAPARAWPLLQKVGLEQRAEAYPDQLSGGQQRRVAIARALINQPNLLLADEPTGDLDRETEEEIMALLRDVNATGVTLLVVTHNPDLALHANRRFTMEQGHLTETTRTFNGRKEH